MSDSSRDSWERWVFLGAILFGVVICILGIPCSDDYFFQAWEFANWKDQFLLHPSNSPMYTFVPQNGRYLGNILGLYLGRTYDTMLGMCIRILFMGGCMYMLWWLICRICRLDRTVSMLLCVLLVLSPVHFYTQIYYFYLYLNTFYNTLMH